MIELQLAEPQPVQRAQVVVLLANQLAEYALRLGVLLLSERYDTLVESDEPLCLRILGPDLGNPTEGHRGQQPRRNELA